MKHKAIIKLKIKCLAEYIVNTFTTPKHECLSANFIVRNAFTDYGLTENTITISDLVLLEGDYTNQDIPYFEFFFAIPKFLVTNRWHPLFPTPLLQFHSLLNRKS